MLLFYLSHTNDSDGRPLYKPSALISFLVYRSRNAICRNPHNSSNWDSHLTRHLGYKHTFRKNVVSTKNCLSLCFRKNITWWHVGLSRIGQNFFFLSPVKLCIGGLGQTAVSRTTRTVFNGYTKQRDLCWHPNALLNASHVTDFYLNIRTSHKAVDADTSVPPTPGNTHTHTHTHTQLLLD
jgi:hypothetical protein